MSLILFDLDGTLIESFIGEDGVSDYDTVTVMPGVLGRLDELRARGDSLAIVTNQAGLAFGYQTRDQVNRKLFTALDALGFAHVDETEERGRRYVARTDSGGEPRPHSVYVCFTHPEATDQRYRPRIGQDRRKPSPAMLLEAMDDYDHAPGETLYVGDMNSDRLAAEAAGVAFGWSWEFFGF